MLTGLAVAALLSSCGGSGGSGGSGEDDAASSTTSTTSKSAASATTDPKITIVLAPGRLTVGGNALPFGAPQFQVSSYLERGLGEPEKEDDLSCDAGELHVVSWKTISAYVAAEGLAGWYTDDAAHVTDKGVHVGSTESQLLSAYPAGQIAESSLGREFFVEAENGNALSAIVEGGKVTTLWSGATCVAR